MFGACGPRAFQHINSEVCIFVNKVYLAKVFLTELGFGLPLQEQGVSFSL